MTPPNQRHSPPLCRFRLPPRPRRAQPSSSSSRASHSPRSSSVSADRASVAGSTDRTATAKCSPSMERVQERHAGFRSLKEAVDTTTPAGRMMMQMVGAFAEFERAMLKERTKAGLDAARKEGRIGGRPPKLKPQEIVTLVKQGKKTAAAAARLFGVHPATVSRLLRRT